MRVLLCNGDDSDCFFALCVALKIGATRAREETLKSLLSSGCIKGTHQKPTTHTHTHTHTLGPTWEVFSALPSSPAPRKVRRQGFAPQKNALPPPRRAKCPRRAKSALPNSPAARKVHCQALPPHEKCAAKLARRANSALSSPAATRKVRCQALPPCEKSATKLLVTLKDRRQVPATRKVCCPVSRSAKSALSS